MLLFGITIFLSAFLLFQIQPIIARIILPSLGGSATVWTITMLFFQVMLLAGYAYAHLIRIKLIPKQQAILHTLLLVLCLLLMPITPDLSSITETVNDPSLSILLLLLTTIGLPFWLISASGPLFQYWFNCILPQHSVYRLYALSNVGSLLALLSYPFLIEPLFNLNHQTLIWSIGYFLFVVLAASCAWKLNTSNNTHENVTSNNVSSQLPPLRTDRIFWVLLSASGSVLLLASTNQMCINIAVVPFLWILPLSIYLLSFIICFNNPKWYQRKIWITLLIIVMVLGLYILIRGTDNTIVVQVSVYSLILFIGCMVCHGELVKIKPYPHFLTHFYLFIALGGALGGVFVGLISPLIFNDYWELHMIWFFILLLSGACIFRTNRTEKINRLLILKIGWVTFCSIFGLILITEIAIKNENVIDIKRNFYGVLRIKERGTIDKENPLHRWLVHGSIVHGSQTLNIEQRRSATAYYGPDSGVGIAILEHPKRKQTIRNDQKLNIGIVGMGVGTIAVYAKAGDRIQFYEINPDVLEFSQTYFTYLKDTPAIWDVSLGDARIMMEHGLQNKVTRQYDLLVIDAFSSDAIPVHLLTIEAFKIYWQLLQKNGILAVHISNRYFNLEPVVRAAALFTNRRSIHVINKSDLPETEYTSDWVLVTKNKQFLNNPVIKAYTDDKTRKQQPVVWTDQFSNLLSVLD